MAKQHQQDRDRIGHIEWALCGVQIPRGESTWGRESCERCARISQARKAKAVKALGVRTPRVQLEREIAEVLAQPAAIGKKTHNGDVRLLVRRAISGLDVTDGAEIQDRVEKIVHAANKSGPRIGIQGDLGRGDDVLEAWYAEDAEGDNQQPIFGIRAANLEGFSGRCGRVAIAINHVVFGDKGRYVVATNPAINKHRKGLFIGHIAVEWKGRLFDATGIITDEDAFEAWGMVDHTDPDYAFLTEDEAHDGQLHYIDDLFRTRAAQEKALEAGTRGQCPLRDVERALREAMAA